MKEFKPTWLYLKHSEETIKKIKAARVLQKNVRGIVREST